VHAYVINMARSTERRAHITAELDRIGVNYDIVEAVDGRDLDMDDPDTLASIAPSMLNSDWFLPSHVAVAMSHLRVYGRYSQMAWTGHWCWKMTSTCPLTSRVWSTR